MQQFDEIDELRPTANRYSLLFRRNNEWADWIIVSQVYRLAGVYDEQAITETLSLIVSHNISFSIFLTRSKSKWTHSIRESPFQIVMESGADENFESNSYHLRLREFADEAQQKLLLNNKSLIATFIVNEHSKFTDVFFTYQHVTMDGTSFSIFLSTFFSLIQKGSHESTKRIEGRQHSLYQLYCLQYHAFCEAISSEATGYWKMLPWNDVDGGKKFSYDFRVMAAEGKTNIVRCFLPISQYRKICRLISSQQATFNDYVIYSLKEAYCEAFRAKAFYADFIHNGRSGPPMRGIRSQYLIGWLTDQVPLVLLDSDPIEVLQKQLSSMEDFGRTFAFNKYLASDRNVKKQSEKLPNADHVINIKISTTLNLVGRLRERFLIKYWTPDTGRMYPLGFGVIRLNDKLCFQWDYDPDIVSHEHILFYRESFCARMEKLIKVDTGSLCKFVQGT